MSVRSNILPACKLRSFPSEITFICFVDSHSGGLRHNEEADSPELVGEIIYYYLKLRTTLRGVSRYVAVISLGTTPGLIT